MSKSPSQRSPKRTPVRKSPRSLRKSKSSSRLSYGNSWDSPIWESPNLSPIAKRTSIEKMSPIVSPIAKRKSIERKRIEGGKGKYTILKELGKGQFGLVRLVQDDVTLKTYALKTFKNTSYEREINAGNKLEKCVNVTQVHDIAQDDNETMIFYELMDGDVESLNFTSYTQVVNFMEQCLRGLSCIHKNGIGHNDIKPENIFYIKKGSRYIYKFGDFGLSCVAKETIGETDKTCNVTGSPIFMAPENLINAVLGIKPFNVLEAIQKGDIWSLGIVFYYICARVIGFGNIKPNVKKLSKISYTTIPIDEDAEALLDEEYIMPFNQDIDEGMNKLFTILYNRRMDKEKKSKMIEKLDKSKLLDIHRFEVVGNKEMTTLINKVIKEMLNINRFERPSAETLLSYFSDYKKSPIVKSPKRRMRSLSPRRK